jgi:hypothetical protein
MDVARENKIWGDVIGASIFASAPAEKFYEAVRDVRGFPGWAPGVRRVEVIDAEDRLGEPGMISEWEVSFLGVRRKVSSVLEVAEPPALLRWTYAGPVEGWGECGIQSSGGWTLVEFRTELRPRDALLERLVRSAPVREAARGHLRRSLFRLGRLVTGEGGRFVVGPLAGT